MSLPVLVLFYSRYGATRAMAEQIARGIESVDACSALLRTVPSVAPITEVASPLVPEEGAPYVTLDDLVQCKGIALGSPTRFGNMAAPLKYFWDQTGALWLSGALAGKPATVFTATGSLHGGQETTLLSMMLPLLHHGCYLVGVPYTETALMQTQTGGTPYGSSHLSGINSDLPLSDDEKTLCQAQGRRLGVLVSQLFGAR